MKQAKLAVVGTGIIHFGCKLFPNEVPLIPKYDTCNKQYTCSPVSSSWGVGGGGGSMGPGPPFGPRCRLFINTGTKAGPPFSVET